MPSPFQLVTVAVAALAAGTLASPYPHPRLTRTTKPPIHNTTTTSSLTTTFHSTSSVSGLSSSVTTSGLNGTTTIFTSTSSAILPTRSVSDNGTCNSTSLLTWWHPTGEINSQTRVQDGNVRQSHLYDVQVAGSDSPSTFCNSFVYETIPRNGMGQICDPSNPNSFCNVDDQITIEPVVGITMAWTQFLYSEDAVVKVTRSSGSPVGPNTQVIIRPTNLNYNVQISNGAALITVPYSDTGSRFSVEFQDDLFEYHLAADQESSHYVQDEVPEGVGYVSSYDSSMPLVGVEPRNALLIFASPFPSNNLVPNSPSDTLYVQPGLVTDLASTSKSIVYFGPGVYWMTGTAHAKLGSSVNWVYFAPGAYVKGVIEYTSSASHLLATGFGVLSGEQYVYQANTAQNYQNIKSDQTSLRMWQGYLPNQGVTWTLSGVTANAPMFNSMDFTGQLDTFTVDASDYKQVGAFFGQTDGIENYPGSHVRDVFYHTGDDTIKTYYSNVLVERVNVWKTSNAPIVQFGWYPRQVSNITVDSVNVIHSRYISQAVPYPRNLIASAASYLDLSSTSDADTTKDLSHYTISNWRAEGISPGLMGINPLVNIDTFLIENVWIEQLAPSGTGLDMSTFTVFTDANQNNQKVQLGSQSPNGLGLTIKDYYVGNEHITLAGGNWDSFSTGRLDIDGYYWNHWTAI